jgi:hypothetical protein
MGVLLLFVDGVGVGRDDPEENPFAEIGARWLGPVAGREACAGTRFKPIDATLGVPGLPQSATGQTTLLTGVNAARLLGHHQIGIPGPSLWPLLERESIFLKLARSGAKPTFANAFTREHLEAKRRRWSASTRAFRASGLGFRMWDDDGDRAEAVSHDYTGEWMNARGIPVPRRTADEAASVLARLTASHDLVFYEYFLTDLAGHRGTREEKRDQAQRVEDLVDRVMAHLDTGRDQLILTSDHGNLEESSHTRHTLNPVPLLLAGPWSGRVCEAAGSLTDLAPLLLEISADPRSDQ